ncbi:MAG: hypothetical protein ACFFCD_00940 [Promethearchaeota archaeon]
MRKFRRSSKGQILLLTAIIVCILMFAVGGFLAEASMRRPLRESEDIYFVFANIKAETKDAGESALREPVESVGQSYLNDWVDEVYDYLEELGYTGNLVWSNWDKTASPWSVDFTLIIQSTDTLLQDTFTVEVTP